MNAARMNLGVVGIVVVLTGGFAFGVLMPGMRELKSRHVAIGAEAEKVRAAQQSIGNLGGLYASIVELDRQMKDFRERLPADRQFGEFLNALAENMKLSGIDDYVVEPKPPREIDESRLPEELRIVRGTTVLPVRVTFDGGFAPVMEFVRLMEQLPRLSQVESMKVVNIEDRPGKLRVELLLHTFCRPEL